MKNKEIVLSTRKALVFGVLIDFIVSFILSASTYEFVSIISGRVPPVDRWPLTMVVLPILMVLFGMVIVGYTAISLKYEEKKPEKKSKKNTTK